MQSLVIGTIALGVVAVALGMGCLVLGWLRLRDARRIDELARRLAWIEERVAATDSIEGTRRDAPGREPGGPVMIRLPDLSAVGRSRSRPTVEETLQFGRRFAAVWDRAEAGASPMEIARATGLPIGQVELILGLKRRLDATEAAALDLDSSGGEGVSVTTTEAAILGVYALLVAIWPIRLAVVWWARRQLDILDASWPRIDPARAPSVTALIPARDEEATLADCLSSVCAQDYHDLEILVVDDRSTDRTPQIAAEFAARDPRVRVITIQELPEGWTGKTHALHVASAEARGSWLWFLDADTRHEPENLSIVMEYARARGAALASLLPELRCETFWEQVVQPLAGVVLIQSYPLFWVNDDGKALAFANGQYILIRRDAYDAVGGHAAVRDRFVEDIALAERVKGRGYPIRVALAHGIGSCRMYAGPRALVRGWSRILYDALGRSPWRLLGKVLDPLIFSQSGHVALLWASWLIAMGQGGTFALALLGLSVVHHLLAYVVLGMLYRLSVPSTRHVGWYPLGNLFMDVVLARALGMCVTGRVTWRGTSYPRLRAAHPGAGSDRVDPAASDQARAGDRTSGQGGLE